MRLRGPWLESSRGGTRTPDPLTRNRPACVLGSRKLSGWRAGNPDENPETGPNRTLPTVPTPYPAKKSVTREVCASRDSNAGPSAPEAAPASDHQRWLVSFQALTRVGQGQPATAPLLPLLLPRVAAVLEQRPPLYVHHGARPTSWPTSIRCPSGWRRWSGVLVMRSA